MSEAIRTLQQLTEAQVQASASISHKAGLSAAEQAAATAIRSMEAEINHLQRSETWSYWTASRACYTHQLSCCRPSFLAITAPSGGFMSVNTSGLFLLRLFLSVGLQVAVAPSSKQPVLQVWVAQLQETMPRTSARCKGCWTCRRNAYSMHRGSNGMPRAASSALASSWRGNLQSVSSLRGDLQNGACRYLACMGY